MGKKQITIYRKEERDDFIRKFLLYFSLISLIIIFNVNLWLSDLFFGTKFFFSLITMIIFSWGVANETLRTWTEEVEEKVWIDDGKKVSKK